MRSFKTKILNADEISKWLRIPKSTVYKLCWEGEIPGKKIGRNWRFDQREIEDWFNKKGGPGEKKPTEGVVNPEGGKGK